MNHPEFKSRLSQCNTKAENGAILKELGEAVRRNWEWAWTTSFDDCMMTGEVMLKKMMNSPESLYGVTAML